MLKEDILLKEWNLPKFVPLDLFFGRIATYKIEKNKPENLFFIHGLSNSVQLSAPFLNKLSQYFNIYSFDLPGHGNSDICYEYTLEYLVFIAIEVFRNFKLNRIKLVGHSIGGLIASRMEYYIKEFVDQLVIINPAGLQLADIKGVGSILMKSQQIQKLCFNAPVISKSLVLQQMKLLDNEIAYQQTKNYLKINYEKFQQSHKLLLEKFQFSGQQDVFKKITCSVSVILSTCDQIVYPNKTAEYFKTKAKNIIWIEAYHMCTISIPKLIAGQVMYCFK